MLNISDALLTNMALNMPVQMSTTNGSGVSCFNGSTSQCAQTQWEMAPWLIVDLNRSVYVAQIVVKYLEDISGVLLTTLLIYKHQWKWLY